MKLRRTSLVLTGVAMVAASGCNAPTTTVTIGAADLATPDARQASARQYWQRDGLESTWTAGQRGAVAEFNVAFVTERAASIGGRTVSYSTYLRTHLADRVYAMLDEALSERGITLLSRKTVRNSRAYARIDTLPGTARTVRQGITHDRTALGRARALAVHTASDLRIINPERDDDFPAIADAMRAELEVDFVCRIEVRVGVHDGHPVFESGSMVHVWTDEHAGALLAVQPLISDINVVESEKQSLGGRVIDVRVPRYLTGIEELGPAWFGMAFADDHAQPALAGSEAAPPSPVP